MWSIINPAPCIIDLASWNIHWDFDFSCSLARWKQEEEKKTCSFCACIPLNDPHVDREEGWGQAFDAVFVYACVCVLMPSIATHFVKHLFSLSPALIATGSGAEPARRTACRRPSSICMSDSPRPWEGKQTRWKQLPGRTSWVCFPGHAYWWIARAVGAFIHWLCGVCITGDSAMLSSCDFWVAVEFKDFLMRGASSQRKAKGELRAHQKGDEYSTWQPWLWQRQQKKEREREWLFNFTAEHILYLLPKKTGTATHTF